MGGRHGKKREAIQRGGNLDVDMRFNFFVMEASTASKQKEMYHSLTSLRIVASPSSSTASY